MEGEGRDEHVIEKVFCVRLNLAKEAERELLHDPGSGELSRYVREQRLAPQCLPLEPICCPAYQSLQAASALD